MKTISVKTKKMPKRRIFQRIKQVIEKNEGHLCLFWLFRKRFQVSFYKSIIHERYISLALIKLRAQLGNRGVGDVIVVVHHFIDDAIRRQLDDAVGDGLDKLVVMAREEDIAFERLERVVERLDGFEVQVVRRRVEDEAVCVDQHHARNHATHFLAS